MLGFIFFIIIGIYLYVDHCREDASRKKYRDNAKASGKDYYQDFWGKWWYKNKPAMWHINNGREVLTSVHNRNIEYVDLTAEKNAVSFEKVKKFLEYEAYYIVQQNKKGVRYCEVPNDDGYFIFIDTFENKFIFIGDDIVYPSEEKKYYKYYYERVWNNYPLYQWKCVNKKEVTKEEEDEFYKKYVENVSYKSHVYADEIGEIDYQKHYIDTFWYKYVDTNIAI